MPRKRNQGALNGTSKWDSLPWKSIEPAIQRDDGWRSTGGEDQALLYTLEEISGGDYALEGNSTGGTQMVITRGESAGEKLGASSVACGEETLMSSSGCVDNSSKEAGEGRRGKKKKRGKHRDKKRKASPEVRERPECAPRLAEPELTPVASDSAVTATTPAVTPIDMSGMLCAVSEEGVGERAVVGGSDGGKGASEKVGQERASDAAEGGALKVQHRRKRRRSQGKKKTPKKIAESGVAAGVGAGGADRGHSGTGETSSSSVVSDKVVQVWSSEGAAAVRDGVIVRRDGDEAVPAQGRATDVGGDCRGDGHLSVVRSDDAAACSVAIDDVGRKEQQHQQKQHTGEGTVEDGTTESQLDSGGGTAKLKGRKKKMKKKKKKMQDVKDLKTKGDGEELKAATDGGKDGSTVDGRNRWELSADDSIKMLPWRYLGVELHPALLWHLHRQGFYDPTLIQKRVLPKAILGRKDIIGAAETGSGKTLAFGLPILNDILDRRDSLMVDRDKKEKGDRGTSAQCLQALVLCPTRELALQVAAHFREVVRDTGLSVVAVVGGLAEVKQERQLSNHPEVVVATPGRFWEMAGKHAHLSHLENLRYLVVDEADRMLERGHYPELKRLFSALHRVEGAQEEGETRGGRGAGTRRGVKSSDHSRGWSVPPQDQDDQAPWSEGYVVDAMDESVDNDDGDNRSGNLLESAKVTAAATTTTTAITVTSSKARGVSPRQTYVFSATLLSRGVTGGKKRRQKTGGARGSNGDGCGDSSDPVADIMKRLGVRGDPAVIDMSRRAAGGLREGTEEMTGSRRAESNKATAEVAASSDVATPALPSTLQLCSIKSLQMDKDVHAYLFCVTYPGRTLVFVNAIACARRLAALLGTLGVKATTLHAQMQQRQRLKSLDRFTSDPKAVLVATDVAARGLDIPKVEHVVHYDAARSAEGFIHRAGRTARARAAGLSLSIVAPRDDTNHRQTCSVLGLHQGMQAFPVEIRLVDRARERVGMALKVMKFQHDQSKVSASNDFFRGLSKDADLIMDDDVIMEGGVDGGTSSIGGRGRKGNRHAARLAADARCALQASLSRPLHVDRRKLIPVAQALVGFEEASRRTAAGDLIEDQRTRSQRKVSS